MAVLLRDSPRSCLMTSPSMLATKYSRSSLRFLGIESIGSFQCPWRAVPLSREPGQLLHIGHQDTRKDLEPGKARSRPGQRLRHGAARTEATPGWGPAREPGLLEPPTP